MKSAVEIETEWNLKVLEGTFFQIDFIVEIETEWNLKKAIFFFLWLGRAGRDRNRVEFKVL